jgi:hypothetical protein
MANALGPDLGGLLGSHQPGEMTPEKVARENFTGQQPSSYSSAYDFLWQLTKRLEKEDQITDRLMQQKWLKLVKFYEGEHLGRFDARGQWRSYQPQMGDPYYIHPLFRFHSDAITSAWTQSRPDIRVLPANDTDETIAAARRAQQIIDHYEAIHLTEDFLQREGKLGQFTGQMYRYTWWDPNAGPEAPTYEMMQQEVPLHSGGFLCQVCGHSGDLPELFSASNHCPICSSPPEALQIQDPQSIMIPQLNEMGKHHIGDIMTETVPAFQIKVDRSTGMFERASFLRRRRMIRPEILKEMFPSYEPPRQSTSASSTDEFGLRAERLLQQSTGIPGRAWRPDTMQNPYAAVIINQWWLKPFLYSSRLPEQEDLNFLGGQKVPKGAKLIDFFPEGMYLLVVDNKILDIREEDLHSHWQHSPFILIPTRAEGDGIEDLLEPSREYDDLMSLLYTDIKSNAAPPTLVNTSFGLKTTDISGKPHWVVPARVPPGESLQNGVLQLPGRGAPYSAFKILETLQQEQQLLAKSFSPASGAPDMVTQGKGSNTATGANLATAAAQAQRGPELGIRAAGSLVWARQVLKLYQKNAVDAHYIPKQGRYGVIEGQYFKGADISSDFIFTIRGRSWIPRDEFSRRNDLMGAIQSGLLNPQFPKTIRDAIAEEFNVPIDVTGDIIADTRLAQMRLTQMKQAFQQLSQMIDPNDPRDEQLLPVLIGHAAPLEPVSDNHQIMEDWYIEWMKTDDGIMAPPPLRQAVIQRIIEHEQAFAQREQYKQSLMLQAQAPQLALQQHQQDQQREHEAGMQQQQLQAQAAQAKQKASSSGSSK